MCDSLTRIKAKGKLTVKMADKALERERITTEEALILKVKEEQIIMYDSLARIKAKGKLTVKMVDKALEREWITTEEALILKEGLS